MLPVGICYRLALGISRQRIYVLMSLLLVKDDPKVRCTYNSFKDKSTNGIIIFYTQNVLTQDFGIPEKNLSHLYDFFYRNS